MKKHNKVIAISLFLFIFISAKAVNPYGLDISKTNSIDIINENIKGDTINIAFKKSRNENIVGAVSHIDAVDVNKYDNIIWAGDVLIGRTLGMIGYTNVRGIGTNINVSDLTGSGTFSGNALFVVDGLPRDIEGLRLSEVESISVLKDINSYILYGSAAINGVILITTKRGKINENTKRISLNYGISTPLELPKYLNSSDYMSYHNQARLNDGLQPLYSNEMIDNYQTGNIYRYPNVDFYSSEYVKSYRPYLDVNGEFAGGNEAAKYYLNFGLNSIGSWLNFGEGANSRNNRFNVRGNVDLRVTDWINTSIDAAAIFGNDTRPVGENFFSAAATIRPHEFTPLIPIDLIDPDNPLLRGIKNDVGGQYLIGGNINNQTTVFGNGYLGSAYETIDRKFSFNNRINFNLSKLIEGLSFNTNLSFDYYSLFDQTVDNQYSSYEPTWLTVSGEDQIIDIIQYGKDASAGTQIVGNTFFRRRIGFYGSLDYETILKDTHKLSASLLGYGNQYKEQGDFQGVKQAHLGLRLEYAYDNKYLIDFSSAYVNSVKLPPGNRTAFSPSAGLGWLLSSEDFLKDIQGVDFLKLKVTGGILNSDMPINAFYLYDNIYSKAGNYDWFEGQRSQSGVMSSRVENLNLGFSKKKEVNVGIEGLFFNRMLGLNANLFHDIYSDLLVRPYTRYPSYFNDFIPYENYEKDKYTGIELGLSFNKKIGDWGIMVGLNTLYVTSERIIVDEVYEDDYRYRAGYPKDASFGLEALGLFQSQEEIDNSPLQAFGTVQPGDIKYKDQNGDGIIDSNDEVYLRRWLAPFSAGLQLMLTYKDFNLYVLGEGRTGSDGIMSGNYYWVDGNKKYSDIVLNSWTTETAETATYPRLSSVTNNNNFRTSSYWLFNNDYFQFKKIQLTYSLPITLTQNLKMTDFDIFINVENPYQFAKNRKIRETTVGSAPQNRTFSIGLKTEF